MKSNRIHISILEKNIFSVILVLTAFGTVVMYSASSMINPNFDSNTHFLIRHLFWITAGLICGYIASRLPLEFYKKNANYFLYGSIFLIVMGIFLNPTRDSSRWLIYSDGAKQITTSDFGRLSLIIYTAWFLDKYRNKINDFKNILIPFLVMVGLVLFAILSQPDLSTTIVIGALIFVMLIVGGLNLKNAIYIIAIGMPVIIYKILTTDYIYNRLKAFILSIFGNNSVVVTNQTIQPLNDQVDLAIMAMGSSGFFGRGLGDGLLKKGFIPEIQGDFIFSVIGEEFGLFSETLVLGSFIYLFIKGMQLAQKALDPFSMFLVLGISFNFIFYAIINISYVIKLLPTTGLALPFISYGGTQTIISFIMVGLLFNVIQEVDKRGY